MGRSEIKGGYIDVKKGETTLWVCTLLSLVIFVFVVQLPITQASSIHLNRYHHFTELMKDPLIECDFRNFKSNYDRKLQTVLVIKPGSVPVQNLIFFFHGMGGDSGDAVVVRDLVKHANAMVISMGGRGPSWVSNAFLADAEQVINKYSRGYNGFYLMGISMGGTQALVLSGLLPASVRKSIRGVIALIPGSDLVAIAKRTSVDDVRDTLMASVKGDWGVLAKRSPVNLIKNYNKSTSFFIFYNTNDTLLLSNELEKFNAALSKRNRLVTLTAPGEHKFTYTDFDYKKVFELLTKKK